MLPMVKAEMPAKTDSRMSPLSLRILAAVSDGEWRLQEDLIEEVQYLTPPGEAFRHWESLSASRGVRKRDMDDMIASGRRAKAVAAINSLIQNNRLERNTAKRDEVKKIRLKRAVPQIYIVRSADGELTIHPWAAQDVAIHVIDSWNHTDDPAGESGRVQEVLASMPPRIEGRQRIEKVCRDLMNRLNVSATLKRFMETPSPTAERSIDDSPDDSIEPHDGSQI